MTYSMASIIKKTIRGRHYYYARECRRVDGKPTIVWQKYLGRADDIIAALADPQSDTNPPARPREAVITDFGAAVALYDRAQQLKLERPHRPPRPQGRLRTLCRHLLAPGRHQPLCCTLQQPD